MKQYEKSGNVVTLTAPADVVSGEVVKVGQLIVVAQADVLSGLPFEGVRIGQFGDQPKDVASAWTEGALLFWDDGNSRFTTVSASGLLLCAVAGEAAIMAATTGTVILDGNLSTDVP